MFPPSPEMLRRPFADLRPFLEFVRSLGFLPATVVDVGANRGAWTRLAKEVFPDAGVLMIEPQPELAPDLDETCRSLAGVEWVETAVGAETGERVQTIWEDTQGSSFLPTVTDEGLASGRQRSVRMRRLDDVLTERGLAPDLVKLDVQGYELEVLRGAPSLFGRTELFILETSLYVFLPDLPLLREVISFMAERGYEIYDIVGWIRRPIDGALGQLDIAFVRSHGFLRNHDRW